MGPHPDAAGEQAVLAPGVQVGEEHGNGLAHEPAPVYDDAEPSQCQASMLEVEQLAGG